ncbi:MAG: D-alanine--D-alanine ligase A [Micrococcales bacterium 73-13]|nr:MAG: D-alanine--D-alanine ligase A [Micrococcales bacterium 73-13]
MEGQAARRRVAVVFGGRSSEHEISCATAGGVLAAIDRERFDVVPIGITREGAFTLQPDDPERLRMDPDAMPVVVDNGTRVLWPQSAATRLLRVIDPDGAVRELGEVDVAFPILHGPWGEDGTIQGLFELVGLPYVGSGVLGSALGMDKHVAKVVLQGAGVPVAPWIAVAERDWSADAPRVRTAAAGLGLPVFVKPARAGSSVGVTKVASWDGLEAALRIAWAEDRTALVEAAIEGRELECGVLGARAGAADPAPRVSLPGEIVMRTREFYDYAAKYLDPDAAELICPAEVAPEQLRELQRLAARVFESIGCRGLARVDFFLTGSGPVVNEINTMPGFTPISMFPKCWAASGIGYRELISELLDLALEAGA